MSKFQFIKFVLLVLILVFLTPSVLLAELTEQEICQNLLSENIAIYNQGPEIIALQKFLNSSPDTRVAESGPGSIGNESMHFGPLTYEAVIRFQEKYKGEILNPLSLENGTGYVGPYTRAQISKLCTKLDTSVITTDVTKTIIPESLDTSEEESLPEIEISEESNYVDNTKITNKETFSGSISSRVKALGGNGAWSLLNIILLIVGINFIIWAPLGLIRLIHEKIHHHLKNFLNKNLKNNVVQEADVAVMIPAHNEEMVIADTLNAITKLVKPENIFVISDGSKDETGNIVRTFGVNLLELNPGKGKAGALETGIAHFEITKKYKALILLDADTRLKHNYLKHALPFFNDPEIVAVAGYAATMWNPKNMSWKQLLFVSHRDRVYFLTQRIFKFGQTWKHTNVTHIVPGFASIYRTHVLEQINMNPIGLIIEDFNMTFELHHKKLGKVAHHPKVVGYTQDPDNMRDYFRQVKRWKLGFWQTIRFHGFWFSKFWLSMIITLIETTLVSLAFLLLPSLFLLSSAIFLLDIALPNFSMLSIWPQFKQFYYLISTLLIWLWVSDYIITIFVSIFQKRVQYLVVGLFFPLVRFLDSIAFLSGIPKAFLIESTGKWVSPTRRKN